MSRSVKRHPVQPVEWNGRGVLRFRPNPIVQFLLDQCPVNLSQIGQQEGFTVHDWDQLHQLLGYSVSGCPILDRQTRREADLEANAYVARVPSDPKAKKKKGAG